MAFEFYDQNGNKTGSLSGVSVGAGVASSPTVYQRDPALQQWIDDRSDMNQFSVNVAKEFAKMQEEADRFFMQFSADEAQKLRDWQAEQSNTAYQRAVADMRKAGLNPVLAYAQGGASTPSGAAGQGVSSARHAPQLNLENVTATFKSLLANIEQSANNAKTYTDAQKWSTGVSSVSNLLGSYMHMLGSIGSSAMRKTKV